MIDFGQFKTSEDDLRFIHDIADRASQQFRMPFIDTLMDVEAAHNIDGPLDLAALLASRDADFTHDIGGIHRHLDHDTGGLTGCFQPRCGKRKEITQ